MGRARLVLVAFYMGDLHEGAGGDTRNDGSVALSGRPAWQVRPDLRGRLTRHGPFGR